jgi:CHAT domain-containing protein
MSYRTCLTVLLVLSLGFSGCVKGVAVPKMVGPAAPKPLVKLEGPYDSEIPKEYFDRLANVSSASDETVPLTFMSVADYFAGRSEVEKAIHFFNRAAVEFVLAKKQPSGEAAIWIRKVMLLSNFGREAEANNLVQNAQRKWVVPPLCAFPEYKEGHQALLRGDFSLAVALLTKSLQDNAEKTDDFFLRLLRRDAELDLAMAKILVGGIPILLAVYGETSAPSDGMDAVAGKEHLLNALALNQELRESKFGRLLPASDFEKVEAEALTFLGLVAWGCGDKAEAFKQFVAGGAIAQKAGLQATEMRGLTLLGELGLQGEYATEGRAAAGRLLHKADLFEDAPYRIWARLLMARYEKTEKRNAEAITLLHEAAAIIEAHRFRFKPDLFDEVSRFQRRAVYEMLVELLAAEKMVGKALTAAEKAKRLMTVDLLADEEVGKTGVERELLKQERGARTEIVDLHRRLLMVSDETAAKSLREQLKSAERVYRGLLDRMGSESDNLLSLIAVKELDPAYLQRSMDDNTTIFDYFTTTDALYVWAVHREQVHLEKIDLPREEVRSLVFSFLSAIRDKDKKRTESLSQKTYDLLLKPLISFVSGDRICFIPDDALVYFPFAAMSYRGQFLAGGFSIFYLPEAGLWEQVMRQTGTNGLRILSFVDPDSENEAQGRQRALQEVERIRKRFSDATVLSREQAMEAKTEDLFSNYDIIHFAVREQFFPDDVLNSGLLLSPGAGQDGRLTLREIFQRQFHTRAVVLSGCDPMPEKDPKGTGPTSLQRSFLSAGSLSVISSRWLVNDKAAARLLDFFYRYLEKRESMADALRSAQLRMIQEGYPPYVWAAFVLTGKY